LSTEVTSTLNNFSFEYTGNSIYQPQRRIETIRCTVQILTTWALTLTKIFTWDNQSFINKKTKFWKQLFFSFIVIANKNQKIYNNETLLVNLSWILLSVSIFLFSINFTDKIKAMQFLYCSRQCFLLTTYNNIIMKVSTWKYFITQHEAALIHYGWWLKIPFVLLIFPRVII
jgi:hypothetical protein